MNTTDNPQHVDPRHDPQRVVPTPADQALSVPRDRPEPAVEASTTPEAVRAAQGKGPLEAATLDRAGGSVVNADGRLQVVDNQISASSGTFRLRAEFPNADQALWPGQFVNVRMKLDELPDAVVVPAEAVQRSSTGDFVYLIKPDNTVTLREVVQGGQVDDSHVVISKGLQPGDKVVTEGQFRLKEGVAVNPLQPGQAPPAPTEAQLKAASEKRGGGGRGGRGPR